MSEKGCVAVDRVWLEMESGVRAIAGQHSPQVELALAEQGWQEFLEGWAAFVELVGESLAGVVRAVVEGFFDPLADALRALFGEPSPNEAPAPVLPPPWRSPVRPLAPRSLGRRRSVVWAQQIVWRPRRG